MSFFSRFFLLVGILASFSAEAVTSIMIQKIPQPSVQNLSLPAQVSAPAKEMKIALIGAPKVIGKYANSTYNVALATLMAKHPQSYTLTRFDIPDESEASLAEVISTVHQQGFNAILAPLTVTGVQRLSRLESSIDIFIPTVHKRDVPDAPENFVFGAIDYVKQMEALLPYMGSGISIFYDDSAVGKQLKQITESLFLESDREKKSVAAYPVDAQGNNIIAHLSKPSAFAKKSVILHIPVVKSAILTAHMTFTGIKERNILSTQINIDPTLITLTQYNDRKNMILANSIVEHAARIDDANTVMNNDIAFDWIQYATSVGTDYLVAKLENGERDYTMRIIGSQVIYPVQLLKAKEFGFEPITAK